MMPHESAGKRKKARDGSMELRPIDVRPYDSKGFRKGFRKSFKKDCESPKISFEKRRMTMTMHTQWFFAALTAAAVVGAQPQPQYGDGPQGGRREVTDMLRPGMMKELNLTSEQRRKIREYHLDHEKKAIQLHSDKAMAEIELMKVMQAYPVHTAVLIKQGEKIDVLDKQLHQMRLEGLGFFLEQLTPEQHQKFIELHEDMRQRRKDKFRSMNHSMGWRSNDGKLGKGQRGDPQQCLRPGANQNDDDDDGED
jgi:Spy/CpxP family protein refolding chaperone